MPVGLQEWIHRLEEGSGRRYLQVGALFLGLAALIAIFDLREFKNLHNEEAMDAAQLARNLSETGSFTTKYIRPFTIHLLQRHRGTAATVLDEPHPDVAQAPFYPLVLAGLIKVLPFQFDIAETGDAASRPYQPDMLIALFNQALFVIALVLVFFLARRLFDSAVAWLSVVLMTGTALFWRFTASGLPTMLLLVLFLGLVWCLVLLEEQSRAEEESRGRVWGLAGAIGVLLGFCMLTRYSFGWLIVPTAVYVSFLFQKRLRAVVAVVLLVFLVVISPWIIRNYAVSGTPLGVPGYAILQETSAFPDDRLERSMQGEFEAAMSRVTLDDFFRKLFGNLAEIVQEDLPRMAGNWMAAFFLVGLLIPFMNPALARLRGYLVGALVLLIMVQALGKTHLSDASPVYNSENLLVVLAPLVLIFGSALFFTLLDQVQFPHPAVRTGSIVGFVLILSMPLILLLMPPKTYPLAYPPYYPQLIRETASWMDEDELMMSDMPWAVAWYGDRQSLLVTLDAPSEDAWIRENDFFVINDFVKPIQGLYLTPLTMDARFLSQMIRGQDRSWGRFVLDGILRTNVPTGFPLKHAPAGFLPDQLFLTDRQRWRRSAADARTIEDF